MLCFILGGSRRLRTVSNSGYDLQPEVVAERRLCDVLFRISMYYREHQGCGNYLPPAPGIQTDWDSSSESPLFSISSWEPLL